MKLPLAFALALSLLSAVAAPASAASFSPPLTPFTLNGPIQLQFGSVFINCWVAMAGFTNSGSPSINGVTIAPSSNPLCATIRPNGLPWTMTPTGPTQLTFQSINISTPFGNCQGSIPGASLNGGLISFNATLPPNCVISSSNLATSPTLSINWP